ncbi:hypothetical protein DSO57_1023630 [Entomophthora muscae]|uniref:Uncharacterized protein n=1 Tax=Entomophthora muscae TaxID=34485 RepID=A0ACC2UNE3_9FUNG|nr:hypothetical protein DSO57_1023630 [Entomophthora muscae]
MKLHQFLRVDELDPHRCVRGIVPASVLGTLRLVFSLFYLIVLVVYLCNLPAIAVKPIAFLTLLSFYGLFAYLLVSTYQSLRFQLNPSHVPWEGWHWTFRFLYYLHYQINVVLSFVVTLVYWSILAKPDLAVNKGTASLFTSISMHAFNSVIIFTEVALGSNPFVLSHIVLALPFVYLYLPYAFLIHAIHGFWIYSFLDYTAHPITTLITIAMVIVVSVLYYVFMWFVHSKRDQLIQKHHLLKSPPLSVTQV